jgi:hypothetical protein
MGRVACLWREQLQIEESREVIDELRPLSEVALQVVVVGFRNCEMRYENEHV